MAALISQLSQVLSFPREHPKLSCVFLLLLSPPIYRLLLYFTPLLLSTALCIFALITLTPYVTATDAEVERQSMMGASSQQPKRNTITATTTTTTSKSVKLAEFSGNGNSSAASSLSSSALSASSVSDITCPSAAPSSSAVENSWFSWMKGLNDIGRSWMESKLIEQGLALSEPANRETLLALIEGSFAELVTAKQNPAETFSVVNDDAVDATGDAHSKDKESSEPVIASSAEGVCQRSPFPRSSGILEVVRGTVVSDGGGEAVSKDVQSRESAIPVPAEESQAVPVKESREDAIPVPAIMSDAGALSKEHSNASHMMSDVCTLSKEHSNAASGTSSTQSATEPVSHDVEMRDRKPLTPYESSLQAFDAIPDSHAATIMPRTPSRIPVPSKILEASRRIFTKEDNRTMVGRAPFQVSSSNRPQPLKPSFRSTQSKTEAPISAFKLPTPKFLERSRSILNKEGGKLSSPPIEAQAGGKTGEECIVAQCKAEESNICAKDVKACVGVNDVRDVLLGASDDFTQVGDKGPKFDEDLQAEEAQALVQSELRMLEVELEEVAAKLPKFDESLPYQKTPVRPARSVTTGLTPAGTSFRSNVALFSGSPTFKTS